MADSDNSAEFFDAIDDFSGVVSGGEKQSPVHEGTDPNQEQEHYYEETKEQMPEAEEDFFFIKKEPGNDKYNQQ